MSGAFETAAGAAVATPVAFAVTAEAAALVVKPGPPLGKRFDVRFPMSAGENPWDTGNSVCVFEAFDARGPLGVFVATVGQREKANTKNMSQLTARLMRNAFHRTPIEETPKNP